MIDTHTHLYLPEFDDDSVDAKDAVVRAVEAGVGHMIFPNVDLTTIDRLEALSSRHNDHVSKAMGLHPTEVGDDWRDVLGQILDRFTPDHNYVAVGEIGMDLYWDKTFVDSQMLAFEAQAQKALALDLPIIIHCREALPQTLEVLEGVRGVRGVFHCFAGDSRDVDEIRRRVGDFYFGIGGVVTFKNSTLRDHLPAIGLERILLETDSPYLAPVPHRGKRNESAFLPLIAACIASTMGVNFEAVDTATTYNARTLFRI